MVASDVPLVAALVGPIFSSSFFFRANFIICLQSLPVPKFICHLLWSCIKANRCVFQVGCVFSPVKVTRTKVVSSFIFVVTRVRNKLFGYMHRFRDLWMPVGLWSIIFCMLLAYIPFVKLPYFMNFAESLPSPWNDQRTKLPSSWKAQKFVQFMKLAISQTVCNLYTTARLHWYKIKSRECTASKDTASWRRERHLFLL
jgi:hypothetical protein